jgi:asparagine synthase (glutamine-hydrolysing)
MPLGLDPVPVLERTGGDPRIALQKVMVGALSRPPCLVSFSGGRDSSALLSVAVAVARQHGLALPVPATLVFPQSEATREDEWQTTVLTHLGVSDWVRIEVRDELDAVGPVATAAMARHGLLWPFNVHFHIPIFERAAGGTVITGFGGDELARASVSARAERVLMGRQRPNKGDPLVVGLAAAPRFVRRRVYQGRARRELAGQPWLTARSQDLIASEIGASDALLPMGWGAKLRRWIWRDRYFRVCRQTFRMLGADHDVRVVHPFVEEQVLESLADLGGFAGFGSRTDFVAALFGDLLPEEVVSRPTKAAFTDPLWTAGAKSFAERWSPVDLVGDLVDGARLKDHWMGPDRNLLSTTLLQLAWIDELGLERRM